jgi:selT/selW/selH-like putative selenoprotein
VQLASAIREIASLSAIPVELKEAELVGTFDVFLDGEIVYSKKKTGRLPHPGEVEQLIMARMN